MKNKRPINSTNVYQLDQMMNRRRKTTSKHNQKTSKVINMMTYCSCCEKMTTRKNHIDGFYLCEDCADITTSELYSKVVDSVEHQLRTSIPTNINWDDEDLDSLYYILWCDDENNPQ